MMKHFLATTALVTLIAGGVFAQTDPAADPAPDLPDPIVEGADSAAEPMAEGADSGVIAEDDAAMESDADAMAADEAAPADGSDTMATDEAAPADEPDAMATDEAAPADEPDAMATDEAAPLDESDAMATDEAAQLEDTTAADSVAPLAGDTDPMLAEGNWVPVDIATFSADRLIGADIVTGDNETVASIEDVLLKDDGSVDNIVAKFGGFLGFGANRVLLTMDEINVMQDPNEALLVRTTLTPESIESRPDYEE